MLSGRRIFGHIPCLFHSSSKIQEWTYSYLWTGTIFSQSYGCTIDYSGQASNEFPILLKFEDNWVVHDYLCIYLKNSAQKAKKDQQNKDRELATVAKGKRRGVYTPQSSCVMMLRVCSISQLTCLEFLLDTTPVAFILCWIAILDCNIWCISWSQALINVSMFNVKPGIHCISTIFIKETLPCDHQVWSSGGLVSWSGSLTSTGHVGLSLVIRSWGY